jgi:hypothetical protein
MDDATGEGDGTGLRVAFDRRLKLEFHGATVTSGAGLLAFPELDDALGATGIAGDLSAHSADARRLFGYDVSHGGARRLCEAAREGAHAGRSCAARHGDHRLRAGAAGR